MIDTTIMVKDCQNRVKQIFSIDELEKKLNGLTKYDGYLMVKM